MKFFIVALILFFHPWCMAMESNVEKRDHILVSLISEYDQISPQQNFKIGLKFVIEKDWHIYWKNPGDSGTAPKIKWDNSNNLNLKISEFHWPAPYAISVEPLMNYGYEKEVVFPMNIQFQGSQLELIADAEWLVCKVECIPGKAKLKLSIPVSSEKISAEDSKSIERALSLAPIKNSDIAMSMSQDENSFFLQFSSDSINLKSFEKIYFFSDNGTYIAHAVPQNLKSKDNHQIQLIVQKSDSLTETPSFLSGILALEKKGEPRLSFEVSSQPVSKNGVTFFWALIFAFLGGLILNLMPCVFPIISIKILSFIETSVKTNTQLSLHGWAYTFGILISFLLLSGVLILLRSLGEGLGWGFQLQSPYFVIFMVVLFYLVALNLLGVFEVGESFMGFNLKKSREKNYVGSFFTGILATLVATPCTAPFMGSALGFAMTLPAAKSILIFLVLGLGMAFPYLVLCYYPVLTRRLPKPGSWMKIFKEILSFPMMLTVLWLLWVLSLQTQVESIIYVLLFLVAIGFSIWVYKNIKDKIIKWILIVLALLNSGYFLFQNVRQNVSSSNSTHHSDDMWKHYSAEELKKLLAEGKPVFIDFTAAWCITCQVNKKVVLNTEKIQLAFKNAGVTLMKADWTNQDPEITKALSAFNRNSVPLYVLYSKEGQSFVLPEILTDDIVLNSLKKL